MSKRKKYKRVKKGKFYIEIFCISIMILICISFIAVCLLKNQESTMTSTMKKAESPDSRLNSTKSLRESYYEPQINIDISNEYKEDFIRASSSCGIDVESISNFQKIEVWEYGEVYAFIYNGGDYTVLFSNSGETVSISDSTPEKIYENKDVELIRNEYEEPELSEEILDEKGEIEKNRRNVYHQDDNIERLITEYNQVAEFKIGENNIRQGAYDFNACVSCNGLWIMIYDSSKMYIDFSIDAYDDTRIYPVFRDFCKTLNKNLTDDDILSGWNELRTGKYKAYHYFYLGGIQCSYNEFTPEIGAATQYTIKIGKS